MIDKEYTRVSDSIGLKHGSNPVRNPIILRFEFGRVISSRASKHLTRAGCVYRKFWRMKSRTGII